MSDLRKVEDLLRAELHGAHGESERYAAAQFVLDALDGNEAAAEQEGAFGYAADLAQGLEDAIRYLKERLRRAAEDSEPHTPLTVENVLGWARARANELNLPVEFVLGRLVLARERLGEEGLDLDDLIESSAAVAWEGCRGIKDYTLAELTDAVQSGIVGGVAFLDSSLEEAMEMLDEHLDFDVQEAEDPQ